MSNFAQTLNEISNQVRDKIERRYQNESNANFYLKLNEAIVIWCNQLIPSQEKSLVVNYISQGLRFYKVKEVVNHIYEDWEPKKRHKLTLNGWEEYWERSNLFNLVEPIFQIFRIGSSSMKIIVFLAFVITAVGYFIYILNKPKKQEQTYRQSDYISPQSQELSYRVSQPASTISPPPAPVQPIVKNSLILVVSAAQQSIVDSIKAKRKIDYDDCEKLYEATQYLCQDTEPNLSAKLDKINQFKAIEKSEYDIYLITVELNQADEGFNKNVNQLDRYDAFRNLANLAVNVQVSSRLQMEAYGNFDVYNR